ncbi:hypothetical protein HY008_03200 [Candidatus Woesebacteria bacterium]|nr:hypothetical protein [Candidatus Woesebacteria bacterium]
MNLVDLNAKVAIAFALTMIAALLTYIAFFKESGSPKGSSKSSSRRG